MAATAVADAAVAPAAAHLRRCALAAATLARPRVTARNCALLAASPLTSPMIVAGAPIAVLAEVVKMAPGAALSLAAQQPDGVYVRAHMCV